MRQTLAIIKPDAVSSGNAGKILAHLEEAGFTVRALRMTHLDDAQAGAFYEVHRERPFYGELVEFMTSGPCIPMVLEADDAVPALRKAIGATDPAEAEGGSSTPSPRAGTPSTPRIRTRTPPRRSPSSSAGRSGSPTGEALRAPEAGNPWDSWLPALTP